MIFWTFDFWLLRRHCFSCDPMHLSGLLTDRPLQIPNVKCHCSCQTNTFDRNEALSVGEYLRSVCCCSFLLLDCRAPYRAVVLHKSKWCVSLKKNSRSTAFIEYVRIRGLIPAEPSVVPRCGAAPYATASNTSSCAINLCQFPSERPHVSRNYVLPL